MDGTARGKTFYEQMERERNNQAAEAAQEDGGIDFVLPWVDGSDLSWLSWKKLFEVDDDEKSVDALVHGDWRYRDMGLLRYWFRGVERFAPWVRKVYFVTAGQKPDWLDETHPKLRLVDHRDYIPEEYLPTFHSDTIELNLHRIPDLSETFVLFNDDTFLLRPCAPRDFFRGGLPVLPCDLGLPTWLGPSHISRVVLNNYGVLNQSLPLGRMAWKQALKIADVFSLGATRAAKNLLSLAVNRTLLQGCFGHLALPHLKSTLETLWKTYPKVLDGTSRHRFRSDTDVNQWLPASWNLATGRFRPANEKRLGRAIGVREANLAKACEEIRRRKRMQICLNDSDSMADPLRCFGVLAEAFEEILPEKSGFEKQRPCPEAQRTARKRSRKSPRG